MMLCYGKIEEQERLKYIGFDINENIDEEYFLDKVLSFAYPSFDLPMYKISNEEKEWVLLHELSHLEKLKNENENSNNK